MTHPEQLPHWVERLLASIDELKEQGIHHTHAIEQLRNQVTKQNGSIGRLKAWQREMEDKDLAGKAYADGAGTALVSKKAAGVALTVLTVVASAAGAIVSVVMKAVGP